MAEQGVYNAVVTDLLAPLRQVTTRLNAGQGLDTPMHPNITNLRTAIRLSVINSLALLPVRDQVEVVEVLRCLSEVVNTTTEHNQHTIEHAVGLLEDLTVQAAVLLKNSGQGMNFDLDPAVLNLTVQTASSLMTALAASGTLFSRHGTANREKDYRKMSETLRDMVQDTLALQLQVHSLGERPIQVTSPFLSVHASHLQADHYRPVILQDSQFLLPNSTSFLAQQEPTASSPPHSPHSTEDSGDDNNITTSGSPDTPERSPAGVKGYDVRSRSGSSDPSHAANGMKQLLQEMMKGQGHPTEENCLQSRAISFKSDPYNLILGQPGKVRTAVASLDLYSCHDSQRVEVKDLPKSNLIAIDIQRHLDNSSEFGTSYHLNKTSVNIHNLMMNGQTKQTFDSDEDEDLSANRSLYIDIHLDSVPFGQRAFPVLVLVSPMSVPYNIHSHIFKQVYNQSVKDIRIILPATRIQAGRSYSVGIAEASLNAGRRRSEEVKGRNYNLSAWWDTCVYWDVRDGMWKSEGCQVTESSSLHMLHCNCSHLTSFGGFFDLIPHSLTVVSVDEFFSQDRNPLIVVLVGAILLTFIVILLMIRPLKIKDDAMRREKVIFSQDNCSFHRQKYEVIMETGFHPDAGSTSKISLILHGEEGVSETRELTTHDSNTCLFQRNSRNHFIITFPENLGRIVKIQLWHNNSGPSPGWFLRQAIVRDLNSGHTFYFLCQKWLAVDKDDGKVEREFCTLDGLALTFSQVFIIKGSQYLSDLHTWLSVFTCPPHSHFTRIQRLFLCLALLLSYMGLATFWFHMMPPMIRGEFGLLDLSWRNMFTGALICCLVFPVNVVMSFLFRRSCVKTAGTNLYEGPGRKSGLDLVSQGDEDVSPSSVPYSILDQSILNWQHIQEWAHRQWQKRQSHVISSNEAAKDDHNLHHQSAVIPLVQQTMLAGEEDTEVGSSGFEDATSQATAERHRILATSDISSIRKKSESVGSSTSGDSSVPMNTRKKLLFPWWCRYLAWTICLALIAAGAAATVWYSLRFGHKRSVMWIQCVYFSLITDIFLLQPAVILLKILCTSLRHCHNPAIFGVDEDSDEDLDLEWEERKRQELSPWQEEDEIQQALAARARSRYLRFAGPLQEKQLKKSRRKKALENKALSFLRNGSILVFLTLLVLILTFGRKRSFQVHLDQAANQMFAGHTLDKLDFMSIKSLSDWYEWNKKTFIPVISSLDTLIRGNKNRTAPELGVLVGSVQLSQIRIKPEPCLFSKPLRDAAALCFHDYSIQTEDALFNEPNRWHLETHPGVWGFLAWYRNTGHVISVNNSRDELLDLIESMESSHWLNPQTRAVVTEMTIYNPPSRLYCSITLLLEVSASGRVLPSAHIRSSQLFHYVTLWEDCLLTCELILLVVLIVMFSVTAQKLFHQRLSYLRHFWNYIEAFMGLVSLLYIMMFIYRFVLVMEIVERLRSTFYEEFVSFAFLGLWDEIIHTLLGVLLFCVMLQWLRVICYNPTIARMLLVYKRSKREILLAAALFGVQLIAFSSLGNLLFGCVYQPLCSFMSSTMTLAGLSIRILNPAMTADSSTAYLLSIFSLFAYVFLHGLVVVYVFSVLAYRLKRTKVKKRLSLPPRKLIQLYWQYLCQQTSPRNDLHSQHCESSLSPEFIMAEILYLVEELLFRMNNLLGTSGLPEKQQSFTDSDSSPDPGDDGISTGGSEEMHNLQPTMGSENVEVSEFTRLEDRVHRIEDKLCSNEPYLAQLLKLDSFGANILSEEEEQDLRSQLEFEIFQQLQKQRQEAPDMDEPNSCLQSKTKVESPEIIASALYEDKDAVTTPYHKSLNNKNVIKPVNAAEISSPHKALLESKPYHDGDTKASKMQTSIPVVGAKALKRSQSLKVPVRDNSGLFESSLGNKRTKQGPFPEKDMDCNLQAKLLMNRHSSVKGKKEMLAFEKLGKKDPRLATTTSILRKPGPRLTEAMEREKELLPSVHKMSSGNVSPQSSEGERGHKRTDSSSGQSGADMRLDTPKMVGKRLDLPPKPTFTHNSILAPPKARPLDLMGEWTAAESSSGSEQEAGLASKRMGVGRRNLRKTKSRGKGKGNDVDIDSAIVLSEDFQARGHRGISDCSIIIHPIPAHVDLDEISIPEEV